IQESEYPKSEHSHFIIKTHLEDSNNNSKGKVEEEAAALEGALVAEVVGDNNSNMDSSSNKAVEEGVVEVAVGEGELVHNSKEGKL
uniref:Uncharacterized protein n=1 Tax=Meloidogyne incognita TaxID=6306 RepID=A0A914LTQ1_MELIC